MARGLDSHVSHNPLTKLNRTDDHPQHSQLVQPEKVEPAASQHRSQLVVNHLET
jgi:hypothetical protein